MQFYILITSNYLKTGIRTGVIEWLAKMSENVLLQFPSKLVSLFIEKLPFCGKIQFPTNWIAKIFQRVNQSNYLVVSFLVTIFPWTFECERTRLCGLMMLLLELKDAKKVEKSFFEMNIQQLSLDVWRTNERMLLFGEKKLRNVVIT